MSGLLRAIERWFRRRPPVPPVPPTPLPTPLPTPTPAPPVDGVPAELAEAWRILNLGRASLGAPRMVWHPILYASAKEMADWGWSVPRNTYYADPHHEFLQRAMRLGWPWCDENGVLRPGPPIAEMPRVWCAPGIFGATPKKSPIDYLIEAGLVDLETAFAATGRMTSNWSEYSALGIGNTLEDLARDAVDVLTTQLRPPEGHASDYRASFNFGALAITGKLVIIEYGYLP